MAPRRTSLVPDKTLTPLPKELENELRVWVFDFYHGPQDEGVIGADPQLIIPNESTGCEGYYYERPQAEFLFHHEQMGVDGPKCGCMIKGTKGTHGTEIPKELDIHRLQLIKGLPEHGFRLKRKEAAMVVVKLFMGVDVPEALRMKK